MESSKAVLGVLISGRGSNMKSIVEACESDDIPARVGIVISNRGDAPGIGWAAGHGLDTAVISHRDFESREAHDRAVVGKLRAAGVDWVCLAGYMRLLSAEFVQAFPRRILNIHPALLPAFPGLDAQQQALDYGVRVTGCTVHLVDEKLDHGPIVAQRSLKIRDDESVEGLKSRLIIEEHRCYVEALSRILEEQWDVQGRRVIFEKRISAARRPH